VVGFGVVVVGVGVGVGVGGATYAPHGLFSQRLPLGVVTGSKSWTSSDGVLADTPTRNA
jgi:hypothetical protein